MLRGCYVTGHGLGGVGGILTFVYLAHLRGCYAVATSLVMGWVGWGGILTFMYLAYIRGCYAVATSLVMGGVGWGGILTFMYLAYLRGCYAVATSLVMGWVGWGGILTFMYLAYIRGCYAVATDGAPCYPKLTSEHSLLHEACNHSKGIFCITKKKEWGNLLVHTRGGIDGMWKISKGAVSSSWSTRKDGVVNPQLLQGIRVWQWRWHHGNSTDFLSLTGKALSKRLEKWHATEDQEKRFQAATTTKPCKYHDIPSKSFNFDRQNLR